MTSEAHASGQPIPGVPNFAVVGDKIQIGNKFFQVKKSGKVVTASDMLKSVHSFLDNLYTPQQFEEAFGKFTVQGKAAPAVQIMLTNDGAKVCRHEGPQAAKEVSLPSGQVVDVACKPDVKVKGASDVKVIYRNKLGKVNRELTDHMTYVASLQKELAAKRYTKEDVQAAISKIQQEAHLSLSATMKGQGPSAWGEKTIADLLQEPGNEGLRAALSSLKISYIAHKKSKSNKKACHKDLQIFLLKNMQRNPKVLKMGHGAVLSQQFVRGSGSLSDKIANGEVLDGRDIGDRTKGWPSEADKKPYREAIKHVNTNLGAITKLSADGKKESVITMRSGKSDTFERLQENVVEALMQQLECEKPAGLRAVGRGSFEFQHTITSYLDPSMLKAFGAKFQEDANELEFLGAILNAADKWPKVGITIRVKRPDSTTISVTLKKPIICNQLLSPTVRGVGTKEISVTGKMGEHKSERVNFVANHQLLTHYLAQAANIDTSALKSATAGLEKALMKTLKRKEPLAKIDGLIDFNQFATGELLLKEEWYESAAMKEYLTAVSKILHTEAMKGDLAAKGLFVLFFRQVAQEAVIGKQLNLSPEPIEELHVADVEIWRNILFDKLSLSNCKQCKSGTDRTAIGIALASAQAQFEHTFGTPFIPEAVPSESDLLSFKKFFRDALRELGISVVTETKGYSGVKWGGGVPFMGGVANPCAYKYLYIQDDIENLKKLGVDPFVAAPDVVDLTRQDLLQKGTDQYRGAVLDPRALYGKSATKQTKALEKLQEQLPESLRQAVGARVKQFVVDELGLKELQNEEILNQKLELDIHVRRLHLDKPVQEGTSRIRRDALRQRVDALSKKSPRSDEDNLELYVLQTIDTLWQRRLDSKKIIRLNVSALLKSPTILEQA